MRCPGKIPLFDNKWSYQFFAINKFDLKIILLFIELLGKLMKASLSGKIDLGIGC
jgi:hypothetical protein